MRILVPVAHPDDEVLGCGGTLALQAARGDTIQVVIAADGETGRQGAEPASIAARQENARQACACLGLLPPIFLELPDQRLASVPLLDLTHRLEAVARAFQPELVLTHDRTDLNQDHRVVLAAAAVAFRPLPGASCRRFLTFETPSATDFGGLHATEPFAPTVFVDITAQMERKLAALACYQAEARDAPHPRSPESVTALATWRGACAGLARAEAFRLVYAIGDNLA